MEGKTSLRRSSRRCLYDEDTEDTGGGTFQEESHIWLREIEVGEIPKDSGWAMLCSTHDRRPAMMVDSADTMYVMADGEKCVDTIDLTVGDVVPVMQTTFTKFEQLWSGPKIADTPAPHK